MCEHKGAPRGVCLSLFVFVRGFFEANTHFITLTLIKNTWPRSRGQSVHKSAQCSVQHSPVQRSPAPAPSLLASRPFCSFNCGAALGSVTAAQRGLRAHIHPSERLATLRCSHAHTRTHTSCHCVERLALCDCRFLRVISGTFL